MTNLPLDLEDLQRKASAATGDKWRVFTKGGRPTDLVEVGPDHMISCGCTDKPKANAAFIAAANPETLLAMIAELREANGLLEEYYKFGLIIDSSVRFSERDSKNAKAIGDLILRHANHPRARKALAKETGS